MKSRNIIFFIWLTFGLFYSCEDDAIDSGIGPCIHTYNEPILHLESIQDSLSNNISFVKLYDLRINGSLQTGESPIINSYSIVADDSIFYCNIPFGFGVEEGKYEFTIEAEGYKPKNFTIENVTYSIFEGGCPSFNDGGKRIDLSLE